METNSTMTWQARHDARTEQKLRELASDLANQVEAGELTELEANVWYARVADRWMTES